MATTQDCEVREAERRWRLSGSEEDERTFQAARLRVGDLQPERLRLAELLGLIPGGPSLPSPDRNNPQQELKDAAAAVGRVCIVRLLVALGRACANGIHLDSETLAALEAAEGWAASPSEETRAAAARTAHTALYTLFPRTVRRDSATKRIDTMAAQTARTAERDCITTAADCLCNHVMGAQRVLPREKLRRVLGHVLLPALYPDPPS